MFRASAPIWEVMWSPFFYWWDGWSGSCFGSVCVPTAANWLCQASSPICTEAGWKIYNPKQNSNTFFTFCRLAHIPAQAETSEGGTDVGTTANVASEDVTHFCNCFLLRANTAPSQNQSFVMSSQGLMPFHHNSPPINYCCVQVVEYGSKDLRVCCPLHVFPFSSQSAR